MYLFFCVVIFLFKCAVEQPPYGVSCGNKVILSEFHYDAIRLWEVDPQSFLEEHSVPLYVLLPAMKDPTLDMLRQAIREIKAYYDPERATERLAQFYCVLYGTTTVSDEVKDMIEKELSMSTQYVDFMTQTPLFQQMLKEGKAEGMAEGMAEFIVQLLRIHFSEAKAELAELALRDIQDVEVIRPLKEATAHLDEQAIDRWLKAHLSSHASKRDTSA